MIDRWKVKKVCQEAARRLAISDPPTLARYAMRELYPDVVEVWVPQPETQQQRELLAEILPVAKEVCDAPRAVESERIAAAIKITIDAMKEQGVEPEAPLVAVLVFKSLFPELARPSHPIRSGLREEQMWPVLHAAVRATYREAN